MHSLHGNALSLLGTGLSYWGAGVSRTKRRDFFPHVKHTAPRGEAYVGVLAVTSTGGERSGEGAEL